MSNSVRPQRWQPTRLPRPWDSPGKNTGVGCHCLLQCMKVQSEREVTQSCPTLHDPMDSSLPGSSVHGIFQARVLEWGAIQSIWNLSSQPKSVTRLRKFRSNALTCWFVDALTKNKLAVIIVIRTIDYFFYQSREGWDIKHVSKEEMWREII